MNATGRVTSIAISLLFLGAALRPARAFVSRSSSRGSARLPVAIDGVPFFAQEIEQRSPEEAGGDQKAGTPDAPLPPEVVLSTLSGDAASIREASAFMVDSFWLRSPQDLIASGVDPETISDSSRSSLITEQEEDLESKYGERIGARALESCLISARDGEGLLGLVGVEAVLLDMETIAIVPAETSESMLKNAVASLGPKQRREYKGRPASEIVAELLPPRFDLVAVLSNLSVSPRARRKGIALNLCREAERLVKEEWKFTEMYLKVEVANDAARGLYQKKMGYKPIVSNPAVGLRVDVKSGKFDEVDTETLLMTKELN